MLIGDRIAAVIDMKADRAGKQLRINQWTWCAGSGSRADKRSIDAELHRFERFQLGGVNAG